MTQLAEPEITTSAAPGRISHWIGGRFVAGTSGRRGDVYNPATGRLANHVDFASAAMSMSASGRTIMWFFAPPSACTRLPCDVPVS